MPKLNFTTKLASLILGIIFASTIAVTYLVYHSNVEELKAGIVENLTREALCAMDKTERTLFERWGDIQIVAGDHVISSKGSTPEEITGRLLEFRDRYQVYASLSFYNPDRIRVADTAGLGLGKPEDESPWVKEVFEEGKVSAAADIRNSREMGTPVIFFASPVRGGNGEFLGAVVSRMPVARIYDLTREIFSVDQRSYRLNIDLMDREGLLLYSNHARSGILKSKSENWAKDKIFMEGKNRGNKIHAYPGQEELIHVFVREEGFLSFPGNGWILEVHVPTKEAFAPAARLRNKILTVFGVAAVLAVLIVWFFARAVSAPLVILKDAVLRIGKGERDLEIKSASTDEIGDLASGVAQMLRDLKETTVSRNYLENIIQNMADPLIVADPGGVIITANRAAAKLLGCREDELLNRNVKSVFPGGLLCGYRFEDLIKEGAVSQRESVCHSVDGREIPVLFSSSAIRGGKNEPQGLVCVSVDITERKDAEEKIQRANAELKRAMEELKTAQSLLVRQEKLASIGTLSAGVAHEILNPLNIIGTIVQVMQLEETTGETGEQLREIMAQVHRATRITNSLREFSHRGKPEIKTVDVHALFERTVSLLEYDMALENITVVRECDPALPFIEADEDQLAQVFLNLLTNARDAMRGGKDNRVTFQTRKIEKGIEIRFSDTGPGIPEEIIGRIFDPFFTTKDPGQGTGLGLSVLHSIIEAHGGDARVESKEGEGAEFVITLPVS